MNGVLWLRRAVRSVRRPTSNRCSSCRWSEVMSYESDDGGVLALECRRFPPVAGPDGVSFPGVDVDDWCGEHR